MENQIYRVILTDKKELEFYVSTSVGPEPTKKEKEVGITVFGKTDALQLDASLDMQEVDSLIDYLQDVKRHCERFNVEQLKLKDQ